MENARWVFSPFNSSYFQESAPKGWTPHKPIIHDATLRSGEYTFNRPFSIDEKIRIARKLDEIGIHMIESGAPAVSDEEKEAARALLSQNLKAQISCSVRFVKEDLSIAIRCGLKNAVMAVSLHPNGMKTMKFTEEELLKRVRENVEYGRDHGITMIVGATNPGWTHLDFIKEFAEVAIHAGAERVRISDPIGSLNMFGVMYLLRELKKVMDPSKLAVRFHNNFGLATANTLIAYVEGVRELSVNALGLGDRSGSASLEEVLLSLLVFFDCDLGLRYESLHSLAKLIEEIVGQRMNPLKPIVGENCFNLIAGSQVNLAKDDIFSITPFLPEVVGQTLRISLGAFSGAASVRAKLKEMGRTVEEGKIPLIVQKVKEFALRKRGEVGPADLQEILSELERAS
jgi:isopropylmalate/homocitrate/citramalate synthase